MVGHEGRADHRGASRRRRGVTSDGGLRASGAQSRMTTFVKVAIWVATAFFVAMLFLPLVTEMLARLSVSNAGGLP